ncbi:MAG: S8 family serine peptidase [Pseudomonadota bacterium]
MRDLSVDHAMSQSKMAGLDASRLYDDSDEEDLTGWADLFGTGGEDTHGGAAMETEGSVQHPWEIALADVIARDDPVFHASIEMDDIVALRRFTKRLQLDQIEAEATTLTDPMAYTGAGQTVVIIDSGFSNSYDQSNTVFSYDFSGRNDADASTVGLNSHGSWVAQVVVDTASDVEIIHLKVFDDAGESASLRDIEQALDFVIDLAETQSVAAVNLSLGFGNTTTEANTRLSDEFAALDDLGVLSIVAAGNEGGTYEEGVNVLAADPNVIGVSAVDESGRFASFSQTDEDLTDIAALGVDVQVETTSNTAFNVSGTSFAAPEVAGIAAVLQEASLDLTGETLSDEEFLEILQQSGTAVTGEESSDADGYRVADADAALAYFIETTTDDGFLV